MNTQVIKKFWIILVLFLIALACGALFVKYFRAHSAKQENISIPALNSSIKTLTERWTYAMQSTLEGKDEIDGVTVDTQGNVIIGGPFEHTVQFGGVPHTAKNGTDFFVSKLSPEGKEIWFISVDSGGDDFMWDLTSDAHDDILLSGGYGGTLTIQGKTYSAQKNGSAYFAKIDGKTGAFKWFTTAGVVSQQSGLVDPEKTAGGNEIKVDSKGNAVAILSASGDSYQIGSSQYKRAGVMDSFIVKLSPEGSFLWVYQFFGSGRKQARAIGINGKDEIAFGHQLIGSIATKEGYNFDTQKSRVTPQGDAGLLTPEGKLKWLIPVQSTGFANVRGAGGDAQGNVYFTGVITEASAVGSTKTMGYKNGSTFLAKYTSEGTQEWIRVMGNQESDTAGELITFDNLVAITSGNAGTNYNLYDEKGTLLQKDIHTVSSKGTRATLTVFSDSGIVVARHSPVYTDYSTVGVLEYAHDGCIIFQHSFYGTVTYANGDSYTSTDLNNAQKPKKDMALVKACGL